MAKVTLKTWTKAMGDLSRRGVLALGDGLVKEESLDAKLYLEGSSPVQTGLFRRSWDLEFKGDLASPAVLSNRAARPGDTSGYASFVYGRKTKPLPGGMQPGLERRLKSRASRHLRKAEQRVKREVRGV